MQDFAPLDPKTLLACVMIARLLEALVFALASALTPNSAMFRHLRNGSILFAGASFFIFLRQEGIPLTLASVLAANLCAFGGLVFFAAGFIRAARPQEPMPWKRLLAPCLLLFPLLWFFIVDNQIGTRAFLYGTAYLFICLFAAYCLFTPSPIHAKNPALTRYAACFFILDGALAFARGLQALFMPQDVDRLTILFPLQTVFALSALSQSFFLTFLALLISNKMLRGALEEALSLNSNIVRQSKSGLLVCSQKGACLEANPAACRLLGIPSEKLLTHNIFSLDSWMPYTLLSEIKSLLASPPSSSFSKMPFEFEHKTPQGKSVWVSISLSSFFHDHALCVLISANDITSQKQTTAALTELATTDITLNIPNRRAFDEAFLRDWKIARRSKEPLGLVIADVDHFKQFNDKHGHAAGDVCLREIAGILKQQLWRPGDLIARFGGEEIAILLPGADYAGAGAVADRLRAAVFAQHMRKAHTHEPFATISLGYSSCDPASFPDLHSMSDFFKRADEALYDAKHSGRNLSKGRAFTAPQPPLIEQIIPKPSAPETT